jgi:hypothetical protein
LRRCGPVLGRRYLGLERYIVKQLRPRTASCYRVRMTKRPCDDPPYRFGLMRRPVCPCDEVCDDIDINNVVENRPTTWRLSDSSTTEGFTETYRYRLSSGTLVVHKNQHNDFSWEYWLDKEVHVLKGTE